MTTSSHALWAVTFLNMLGVDTHTSTGANNYSNIPDVIADLKYLGIRYVRDGDNGSFSNLITMAQAGIKFDFLLAGGGAKTTADLQQEFSVINQVNEDVPGSVVAVEGANEINNFPITYNGVGGLQGAINIQEAIYSMAHSDSDLPGVMVYYFTGYGGGLGEGPDPATTSGLANNDNQHPYPQNGEPPAQWVNLAQALNNETAPYGNAAYTETGYSNSGTFGDNIGLQGQAAYTLDLLMDDAKNGITRTYLYELLEEGDGFGLFTTSNTPTPAATAIHNLTSILADNHQVPASVAPAGFSVSNLPSGGNDLVLIKSTGATDIIIWAEPQITATSSGPTEDVTVKLDATYQSVAIYDPTVTASPIRTLSDTNSVTVGIADHPIIIEVDPTTVSDKNSIKLDPTTIAGTNSLKATQTPTFITDPTFGSGADKLVLSLSASQANERVWISVGGKLETATAQPVTALQSALQTETMTIEGDWGIPPKVGIAFVTADSNIYGNARMDLEGATYDGRAVAAAVHSLDGSSHAVTFQA